jgi:acetyltransferase-like isoleucine patch superfamily enzyme
MFKKIVKTILQFLKIAFVNIFGRIAYKNKYIKGRWFDDFYGAGFDWVSRDFLWQKVFGFNRHVPWPVSPFCTIGNFNNIIFDNEDLQIFHTPGTYFQAIDANIIIGKGTWIAPNVGLITTNHDISDPDRHTKGKQIVLGEKCWIGMNAVIMPGVILGPHTVVGAGAIVTKSFEKGYCVIAGVPAKLINSIENLNKLQGKDYD